MAFVLEKKEDMQNIYEMAKRVYDRQISADEAAALLAKKTEAKTSSLKMYFNIYASMRKGKCYKLGTSAAFTEFLLSQIYLDFGEEVVITALSAAKLHSEYRASVNNEQPGIALACRRFIENNSIDVEYDSLPSYQENGEPDMLLEQERKNLLEAINKPNTEFSATIMRLVEKYQIFSNEDLTLLCDRYKSRELFSCDYSYLKQVDTRKELAPQLKSADGRNRYYSNVYVLNGNSYVMTSQLYGYGGVSSHRDNRKQFFEWVLSKFEISVPVDSEWWPSKEEYDPQISKEGWLELLNAGAFNDSVLAMLSQMQQRGGAATCAELAEETGKQASHYIMTAVHAAEKVHKLTGCPILEDQEDSKYWPVLFVGKRESVTDRYIWKIREELQEALLQFGTKIGRFDSWEIVDETTAIKTCDKSFFDYNGSGVPKEICWFFDAENISNGSGKPITLIFNGKEYSGFLKNDTTDRRRIQIRWNSDLGRLFDTYKNEESKATFVKKQTGVYEITITGGDKEMTTKEQVAAIRKYIEAKGFNYDGSLIENFYLGLKSKPFVILAGTSGTGKTRLVKLFAEAIQAKYLPVPVRPDWSDSSDLFGHKDLNGNFIKGAIIDFVKDAIDDKTTPYILCLDEMNLARVEYYMSDILSVIETREFDENKKITSKPLVSKEYCRNSNGRNEYGELQFPGNLYIVGTVNMDETTFPFSKKVLDRANTIEFSYVDLLSLPSFSTATADKITATNEFLVSKYITLNDCDAADREYIGSVCTTLSRINSILEIANAHIGYRVRDEIVFYMLNNREADLLDDKVAFDNQIMQKILPRVQGSSESIKTMLGELLKICESEKYESSAKKINFMIKRYEEDGFTSYWL